MAFQILKRNLFPGTKNHKPLSLSHFSSSSSSSPPSDQTPADPDPNPLISDVVSILTHLRSKSRWGYLRSLYPSGFSPNDFSQIALHIKNNPRLALTFFHWNNPLCKPNLHSHSTIIHILARARLRSHAYDLIRTAIRASSDPENADQSDPLKVFESLVKTYRQCGSAPFVFDLLIKACLESKKLDPAIHIVRMLLSRGISPGLSTCNALIRVVSQRRGACNGYDVYREIFGLDCDVLEENTKRVARGSPNVETLNALMLGFYQDGMVEKVEEIWGQFGDLNLCRNGYSYSILMAAYCEEQKMSEAKELWEEMRGNGVEADAIAYNTMIGGFCGIGEIEMAEEFFKEMGLSGVESTGATYEHLINGYCKRQELDAAKLVYKDMCQKGLRLEGLTMDALIRGLCDKSRVLEALKVMRGGVVNFGFCPTEKSYEYVISGLCEEGKLEEALKLQSEMVGKGFRPNSEIYGAFIGGYMKQGNKEVAERLRNEMLGAQMFGNGG